MKFNSVLRNILLEADDKSRFQVFYDKLVLQRDQIKDIIGESAEDIVFRFCSLQNRDSYLLDDKCNEYDLIHIAYANLLEEKFRNMSHEGEIISYKNKLIKIKAQ